MPPWRVIIDEMAMSSAGQTLSLTPSVYGVVPGEHRDMYRDAHSRKVAQHLRGAF